VIDIDPLFLWITIFTSPRFSTAPPGCTVRPYAVAKATLLAKGFYESINLQDSVEPQSPLGFYADSFFAIWATWRP
jgi:hypothetical protein